MYLERRNPALNMARFYRLTVTPTLFGEWAVIREWGRIGSPGAVRETVFPSPEEAARYRGLIAESKERRGYQAR